MTCDERKFLLQELRQARQFVEENWKDDLGIQYAAWVCRTEEALAKLEQQNEAYAENLQAIGHWCREVIQNLEDGSDDPPKMLVIRHEPPRLR